MMSFNLHASLLSAKDPFYIQIKKIIIILKKVPGEIYIRDRFSRAFFSKTHFFMSAFDVDEHSVIASKFFCVRNMFFYYYVVLL